MEVRCGNRACAGVGGHTALLMRASTSAVGVVECVCHRCRARNVIRLDSLTIECSTRRRKGRRDVSDR